MREPVRDLLRVDPERFSLAAHDPRGIVTGPSHKDAAAAEVEALVRSTGHLHDRLWAAARAGGSRHRVLVVLQGMDTSGKGGAAKAIDDLLHPSGMTVVGFGPPTAEERAEHFLARHARAVPSPGRVTVFDRSHYEQVLVVRVRGLGAWEGAYDEINAWERGLVEDDVTLLKIMLHLSRDEQAERLLERVDDPTKAWKYAPGDVDDRRLWEAYQEAYDVMLRRCSTPEAPWYVVPADRKWHRDWLVSHLLVETLEAIPVDWPPRTFDPAVERARILAS